MRHIAVVGSGVSGLVAAHALSRTDRVTLFEADDRLGGHADTHTIHDPTYGEMSIDTGFIVHNERTYPTLLQLFDELGVPTQESDMSMSVHDERTGLEYAGALGPKGLFPTWRNAANPRYLRLLTEIKKFHREAAAVLAAADDTGLESLRDFLARGRFSAYFSEHFMTPLVACVWSCDPEVALDYPARYLFTFLEHHGMLTVFGSPTWRTVTGGSREYVARIAAGLDDIRTGTKVTQIRESADGVDLTDGAGQVHRFDAVVLATHPDQSLSMLAEPTPAQHEILGAVGYSENLAQLHTDTSLLPTAERARASWNYQRRADDDGRVLVTYDLSRLMRLPGHDVPGATRYLVTLNGSDLINPANVLATREYAHPIYTPDSVAAQQRSDELHTDRVVFAGAWLGWGFHEDGALSGRRAAERLGAVWPSTPTTRRTPAEPVHYATTIRHVRSAPIEHRFDYDSETWLVDLDALPGKAFQARDHIGDPERTIRENIESVLAKHDIDIAGGRIRMLTQPRSLGYVFNPISVFWCDHADGAQAAVVVEVHNTYGGRHAYVVQPDERGRTVVDKQLYVSPFNDTSGHYSLQVPPPGDEVHVSVTLHREGHPPFVATLDGRATGRHRPRPALTNHQTMARIKRHGIALWLRRLPIQPRRPR